MQLANACARFRQALPLGRQEQLIEEKAKLNREGYLVLENYLPKDHHDALLLELRNAIHRVAERVPISTNSLQGYGSKTLFDGGFDRYDGGTLNRFIELNSNSMPEAASFSRLPSLSALTRCIVGRNHQPHKTTVYQVIHGVENDNPDVQKELHRDTFFAAMKFWYFPETVLVEDGPFHYVPGSHKLTAQRLTWEQDQADQAIATQAQPNVGGSFRINESDLSKLGLPKPVAITCPANTLVIANVLGFHRRGHAKSGRSRLSIYGWQRPHPFSISPW